MRYRYPRSRYYSLTHSASASVCDVVLCFAIVSTNASVYMNSSNTPVTAILSILLMVNGMGAVDIQPTYVSPHCKSLPLFRSYQKS